MAAILVVDDDGMIRSVIKKGLTALGFSVFEAENGNKALDLVKEEKIDLIIMDLVMPHKGGIEALIEIHESYPHIKMIAISGKINTEVDSIQGLARQFKVDAVFAKPFEIFELIEEVKKLTGDDAAR